MKDYLLTALLFATGASAQQVTCQTGKPNLATGTTTTCTGSLSNSGTVQIQPGPNYSEALYGAQRANAAQTTANAQMLQAMAQARLAKGQSELAHQQAELVKQQTEALRDQQASVAPAHQEIQQPARPSPQDQEKLHAAVQAALDSDTVPGLKAKAATLEAILRNSPSDSESFRSASNALLSVNTELAKRGELR